MSLHHKHKNTSQNEKMKLSSSIFMLLEDSKVSKKEIVLIQMMKKKK